MQVDYGARSPLWDEAGLKSCVSLENLPLPANLKDRARLWCKFFNDHYWWDTGWTPADSDQSFLEDGEALLHDLRDALGKQFIIHPRFGSREEANSDLQ